MISKLLDKLSDPPYRKAFVASQINFGIPFQLRALLKSRGKTQEWLARETGMLQPRISGLMNPGRTRPNIETLRRLAEAFDCGLAVRFVPFSELARWSLHFDPEAFEVAAFDEDLGFTQRSESTTSQALRGRLLEFAPTGAIISHMPRNAIERKPVRSVTSQAGTMPGSAAMGCVGSVEARI